MDIGSIILGLAGILSALDIIISFINKIKNPIDKVTDKKVQVILAPINQELVNIREDILRLDKNQCKNYLTEFLEDMEKGVPKTDIEKLRATEVYDHYSEDLHLNSYLHDKWERLMK